MNDSTLDWLLEENHPGVRLRTLTDLCGLPDTDARVTTTRALVVSTLEAAKDLSWMNEKILHPIYGLTALAESGLTRNDVPIDTEVDRLLAQPFDANCGDYMLLRALVMLGYGTDPRVEERLIRMTDTQLPDGGWLCLHRLEKMTRTPKSCMKAAMHAVLLAGERQKRGLPNSGGHALVQYFLKRRLCYRMDNPTQLALHARPGLRTIDAFFPIEVMRVSLPVLLEALAALGLGQASELQEAWNMLEAKLDALGRISLEGTLPKSYLPKERVGRPGKWVTLYAWLAYKYRRGGIAC
ncbi:MAG TPA: hypothetical protein VGL77_11400 [Armatimonadota bacterium]|jgi:hypothetical protein